jgi:transcription elongation factor GreA-like protein
MDEFQKEDMIKSVSGTIEKNYCAIKREDLFKKYKNTPKENMKNIIEVMKNRGLLKYDPKTDKYRLVL